ncbi:MAG TPA: DUF4091 domain-containing protein [archaeon]|nr:DUF4091 domain-containing protein [archaeon]
MHVLVLCLLMIFSAQILQAQVGQKLLESFETENALRNWELTNVDGEISSEHATEGSQSVRLDFKQRQEGGPWPVAALKLDNRVFPGNDWLGFNKLTFDVFNDSKRVIELRCGLRDSTSTGRYASGTFSIPPQSSQTCEIPVAHIFKKIEPRYLGRGEKHTADVLKILSLYIVLIAENSFFLDNVRLVADELEIKEASLLEDPFLGGRVTVECELSRGARCDLQIRDPRGNVVTRQTRTVDKLSWRWDCQVELATMPPGRYNARLTVTDTKWQPDSPFVRELGSFEIIPEAARPEIVAWHEPTTQKIMLYSRPVKSKKILRMKDIKSGKGDPAPVSIRMARNEYEGAQLVFLTRSQTARLSFAIENLRHEKSGSAFPLADSEILQVGYVNTEDPVYYEVDYIGWWPDALLPVEEMYAEPGECMPVWINLKSKADTEPGTYRGALAVWVNGSRAGSIPLEVQVYDVALPTETTIRTAFATSDDLIAEIHGGKLPKGMLRRYHQFVADHRLNVDNIYRSEPPDIETVEYFARRGQLNAFNLKYIGGRIENIDRVNNDAYLESLAGMLDPYVAELRQRGLADKAYLYGFDEIGGEMYAAVKRTFAFLKKRYPEIPTMTTGRDASFGIDSGLEEEVDIWVPLTPVYDLERAKATRARGKEVWWYICISPPHPYANWFIEYPAIEPRLLWWMTYQQRVPGFLYYLTNLRHGQTELMHLNGHNKTNWNPASWRTANGDGCFIYSGPEGPISTIRFENIRDGIEDTELLFLLEKRLGDSGAAGISMCNELITSLTDYTRDVEKFAAVRLSLLERLGGGN